MRNTILNLIGLHPTNGMYGLEIEAEGNKLPVDDTFTNWWKVERDGSLQAGFEALEYVMRAPSTLDGVREQLNHLDSAYKKRGSKIEETQTSGVHVHLNVQNYTMKELFTLYTIYFTVEELLLKYCGAWREGNHFCLRAKDAEYIIQEFITSAKTRNLKNLKTDNLRYCSLNSLSLFKYGSVEFRAMRGTGDLDAIYEWVEIIDRIRQTAQEFPDPAEVARFMSMGGEEEFIRRVFKDKAHHFLSITNRKELIKNGIRIIQPFAFATDWSQYKDVLVNPFRKGI